MARITGDRSNGVATVSGDYAFRQKVAAYRRQGHLDAMMDQGFHPNYDKWSFVNQLAYERGRMGAVQIRAAGLKPITWRLGVTRPVGYNDALRRARDITGAGAFGTLQPNDPKLDTTHLIPLSMEGVY